MNNRGRQMLWLIAGGYLIYTGGTMIIGLWKERPDNFMLMTVFGIVFLIFGGVLCVQSIMKLKEDMGAEEEVQEEVQEETEEEEKMVQTGEEAELTKTSEEAEETDDHRAEGEE